MNALTSVEKAVDVLFHLHAAPLPLGVTQLGRDLGLPKSSAHRLLASLVRRGLVQRDDRGRYAPGLGLVALGLGALDREPLVAAARGVLASEAAALGETFFLVAARAGQLVVLDKAEGTGFLRASPQVGATVPVHATATGKLFLAFDPGAVEPDARPERFTARTPADAAALEKQVERARRSGLARSREEWIAGLSVVAAPILVRGRMLGALALGAPTPRLASFSDHAIDARVRRAADEIAARLSGEMRSETDDV
ncbi:MAG: IclR family transcriptional regulator [Myxococcota bacterium]